MMIRKKVQILIQQVNNNNKIKIKVNKNKIDFFFISYIYYYNTIGILSILFYQLKNYYNIINL